MSSTLKPYEDYKETGLLWLDQMPTLWKLKKVKRLFLERVEKGYPEEPLLAATQTKGVVLKKLYENRTVIAEKDLHLLKLVRIGDFVISLRSFQGGIEYAYYQGIISPAYTIIVPSEEVCSVYFKHLAKSKVFLELLKLCVTGIREGQNIDYSMLKNSFIPLPPQKEQVQIAYYLDNKLYKINKFIKNKKKIIELLKEQKQAIINQAVTKGLDLNVKMKPSGVEWIGDIPEGWDVRYLFQVVQEQKIPNKGINNQNLLSLSYGNIINKDINKTEGLLPTSFETYQLVNPDNIILRLTDLQNDHKSLRVGLVTQKGIITSAYTCLSLKELVMPKYIYLLLHTYDIRKVFYGMGSGVRQSMSYRDIKKLQILIPSIDEQKCIIDYCYKSFDLINNHIKYIEKMLNLVTEYRTSLISSVVTGKVDVRNIPVEDITEDVESDFDETEAELNNDDVEETEED